MGTINYESLIDKAMFIIVKNSLETAEGGYFPGDHHFYITFLTNADGVIISDRLKAKYPEEMTIVLQHQFKNLNVTNEGFSVTLSFNSIPESLTIPYESLLSFADPSSKFGLQFKNNLKKFNQNNHEKKTFSSYALETPSIDHSVEQNKNNVISFDVARRKISDS